jgi:hypothetical protein
LSGLLPIRLQQFSFKLPAHRRSDSAERSLGFGAAQYPLTVPDATPPVGTSGDISTAISIDGDRRRPGCAGSRLLGLDMLMNHGQLQHGRSLPFRKLRHQHIASIRKFDRIMVTVRNIRVDRAKLPHSEIDCSRPKPSAVVSDIFSERQFRSRKQADRNGGFTF